MLPVDSSSLYRGQSPSYAAVFADTLLNPEHETPPAVTGPRDKTAIKRFNVYRNNVTVGLIDALIANFPAVQRITGTDFFRAMARFHVRATPPTSRLLFEYGKDFPNFIAHYEYARSMPWLADVARIECGFLEAYHAADAEPLSAQILATVSLADLANLVFVPHPAARIVRSAHPVVSIFAANRSEDPVGPIKAIEAEDALITRPGLDVIVRLLPKGGAIFLQSLISGKALGVAVANALDATPSFELSANIAGMIEAGVFTTIKRGV